MEANQFNARPISRVSGTEPVRLSFLTGAHGTSLHAAVVLSCASGTKLPPTPVLWDVRETGAIASLVSSDVYGTELPPTPVSWDAHGPAGGVDRAFVGTTRRPASLRSEAEHSLLPNSGQAGL